MNIDEILKYKRPKHSYYDLLGCSQSSSVDQINREYKIKALHLHPDKNSNPESVDQFKQIQEAKEILTDYSKRKLYDTWLGSGINIPFEQFQAKKGHSMHWAPPRRNAPLGIEEQNLQGQGSDLKNNNNNQQTKSTIAQGVSLLDKFRKYEI